MYSWLFRQQCVSTVPPALCGCPSLLHLAKCSQISLLSPSWACQLNRLTVVLIYIFCFLLLLVNEFLRHTSSTHSGYTSRCTLLLLQPLCTQTGPWLHSGVPGCSDCSSAVILEMHACDQHLCCLLFPSRQQYLGAFISTAQCMLLLYQCDNNGKSNNAHVQQLHKLLHY